MTETTRPMQLMTVELRPGSLVGNIPDEFIRRIESSRETIRSNCIGTALYIAGEIPADIKTNRHVYGLYLKNLMRVKDPVEGALITWDKVYLSSFNGNEYYKIGHMGIVTSLDPLLITSRKGEDEPFVENEPFERIQKENSKKNFDEYKPYSEYDVAYYIPNALLRK